MSIFAPELAGKRLELLKAVAPEVAQVVVLVNPTNPNASKQLSEIEAAGGSIGVRLKILKVPSTTEFDKALSGIGRGPTTALFISSDALFFAERRRIATFKSDPVFLDRDLTNDDPDQGGRDGDQAPEIGGGRR